MPCCSRTLRSASLVSVVSRLHACSSSLRRWCGCGAVLWHRCTIGEDGTAASRHERCFLETYRRGYFCGSGVASDKSCVTYCNGSARTAAECSERTTLSCDVVCPSSAPFVSASTRAASERISSVASSLSCHATDEGNTQGVQNCVIHSDDAVRSSAKNERTASHRSESISRDCAQSHLFSSLTPTIDSPTLLNDPPARANPVGRTESVSFCPSKSYASCDAHCSRGPAQPYTVQVVDRFGMPAELPPSAPRSLVDLLLLCPPPLRERVSDWLQSRRWTEWTLAQSYTIPFAVEGRDVLWISPPSTGKTFSYVFPSILRMALADMDKQAHNAGSLASDGLSVLQRQVKSALSSAKDSDGVVCRYCELDVRVTRVCPMTGLVHEQPCESPYESESASSQTSFTSPCSFSSAAGDLRAPQWLSEISTVAQPRVLVLVPTAVLATQVQRVFAALGRGSFRARALVRASSAEEQRAFLRSLTEADVLISSPETILPALLKHKLSLRRVQTLVLDEVDSLVSMNHFEPVKMILAALPRHEARPQRLLCGASLPPVVYRMLRDRMLLPTHRFVLVDVARNALNQVSNKADAWLSRSVNCTEEDTVKHTDRVHKGVASGDGESSVSTAASGASSLMVNKKGRANEARPEVDAAPVVLPNSALQTHIVFMLGRVEKMHKLAWMYQSGLLHADQRAIVFCNSRHNVGYVHDKLAELVPHVRVCTMHSRTSATARHGVLRMFESGVASCLVCTDLLSRGVDFENVVYVVHYDTPGDIESWMHRSGRCGRHGKPGYVYTFFQPENVKLAKPLVAFLRQHRQLVPPKLQEYAKQSFVDVFTSSLFNSTTRPYRASDPQLSMPVLTRGRPRFPDYRQSALQKHFRPL